MSYPAPGGYPAPQGQPAGGYPPQQGQHPGGYPPQQAQPAGGYPAPQGQPAGGYPAPQGQPAGGYPPQQGQPAGGYPAPQQGQPTGGYPAPQGQMAGQADAPSAEAASAPEEVENYTPGGSSDLKTFEGYGDVGFGSGGFVPPPPPPSYEEQQPPSMDFGQAANITAEEARAALLEYVAQNCCYGKGAAEKMEMTDINPSNAFHYTLETFCEGRTTARTEVPYFGDAVDGPFNGPPPMPWDVACAPPQQFADQVFKLAVPHTEEVRICGMCIGGGFVRCNRCHGLGRNRCLPCGGNGRVTRYHDGNHHHETCHHCHGSGRERCIRCHGNGRVTCPHCKGQGRVKAFIEMTITYKNHVTDYILEETAMPDELIRQVAGVEIFNQVNPQVWPITSFPVRQVNDNSIRLVEEAKRAHPIERQLNQRQILRAVPVTEVEYKFKDKISKFWVYGMQRKVHTPDYPEQCCCGCTIL